MVFCCRGVHLLGLMKVDDDDGDHWFQKEKSGKREVSRGA
jgi:hypothetical protein